MRAGDKKIQELKNKHHQLKIKEYHCQKDLVRERKANKQLKQDLNDMRKNQKELQNTVTEIQAEVESMRDLKVKIKNCRFRNSVKEKDIQDMRQRHENEIEKLKCSINSTNDIAEKMKVQEKEQEYKMKDIEKIKMTIINLENSLYLK